MINLTNWVETRQIYAYLHATAWKQNSVLEMQSKAAAQGDQKPVASYKLMTVRREKEKHWSSVTSSVYKW